MLLFLLFVFGLIVGSFANVIIYRLPRGISFVRGRSMCVSCGTRLPWYDLVPVISWLLLWSRCRSCRQAISLLYPLVEVYSGGVFLFAYVFLARFGTGEIVFSIIFLELLLILGVIDWQHMILPDSVISTALIVVLVYGLLARLRYIELGRFTILSVDSLLATGFAFAIFALPWLVSRGKWIGFGDAKLAGLVGLVFGPLGSLVVLYLAIVLGAVWALLLLSTRRAELKTKLPLGSFICLSASLYLMFGTAITTRFLETFRFVTPFFKF